MTEINRIARATEATPAARPSPEAPTNPRFQDLLERLQKLADERLEAKAVDDPDSLREALRTADDGFVAAMDLRRQLEEAFKKHMP